MPWAPRKKNKLRMGRSQKWQWYPPQIPSLRLHSPLDCDGLSLLHVAERFGFFSLICLLFRYAAYNVYGFATKRQIQGMLTDENSLGTLSSAVKISLPLVLGIFALQVCMSTHPRRRTGSVGVMSHAST